jgi:hypothetical protein
MRLRTLWKKKPWMTRALLLSGYTWLIVFVTAATSDVTSAWVKLALMTSAVVTSVWGMILVGKAPEPEE